MTIANYSAKVMRTDVNKYTMSNRFDGTRYIHAYNSIHLSIQVLECSESHVFNLYRDQ